jgi:FHA domain
MNETLLFVFALALPVPITVFVAAGVILAVVILVAAILLFRSGGKKKDAATNAAANGSSWQPQGQAGAPGAWNQQGAANPQNSWGQPGQQPGQQGGWGAPNTGQPANPWGAANAAQQPQQAGWGQSSPQQPQQAGWGASPAMNQQQGASPWGAQNAQQQGASPWGAQNAQQPAWDQAGAQAAPAAQDPWAQQQAPGQGASPWGAPGNTPAQPQPQTAYGGAGSGPSWGQPANQASFGAAPVPAEQWGASAAQQQYQGVGGPAAGAVPGVPSWQQGGFPQGASDNDRTMLRTAGPQTGMGVVSVEEGKEPGRVYPVNKESLSIGRSRESDIFLEDLAVSRLHASILNMGNGNYALKDEGSANGTKVNGQLVNKYQTYPLQEGDRIQLGQTVLVFSRR